MECAAKPAKSSSNISEIVSKFTKVCRLRSIGVFSTEDPNYYHYQDKKLQKNSNNAPLAEDSSDVTEEGECDGVKVHPQPVEIRTKSKKCAHVEIDKLFETISVLKLAYVQLQEAHIPHDPDKIKTANELVVSQLDSLCKIKRAYKEKRFKSNDSISACSVPLLAEIQIQERLLEKLKSQVKGKEVEVTHLQKELNDLDVKNIELAEECRRRKRERDNIRFFSSSSIQDIAKAVSKAIHDFAKPLIALMKVSGWDLDQAANAIEDSVVYSKRSHKKYAFEAYIACRMFYGISFQAYNVNDIMRFDDPLGSLIEDQHSIFAKFCRTKYLLVVHPKMEASFFGNLDHRTFVASGRHPRTPFYQAFVEMAKWVWVLQGIAMASSGPKAEIFGVKRGQEFLDVYMECVEEVKEERVLFDEEQARFKVEFMIMPGIRIGETVIRPRVYVSKMSLS